MRGGNDGDDGAAGPIGPPQARLSQPLSQQMIAGIGHIARIDDPQVGPFLLHQRRDLATDGFVRFFVEGVARNHRRRFIVMQLARAQRQTQRRGKTKVFRIERSPGFIPQAIRAEITIDPYKLPRRIFHRPCPLFLRRFEIDEELCHLEALFARKG